MYPYVITFIILIIIAAIIFRMTQKVLDKMPGKLGENLWFLLALVAMIIIIISIHNPLFWKKHTNGNGLGGGTYEFSEHEMELDAISG